MLCICGVNNTRLKWWIGNPSQANQPPQSLTGEHADQHSHRSFLRELPQKIVFTFFFFLVVQLNPNSAVGLK
jgi:hypothetical protein